MQGYWDLSKSLETEKTREMNNSISRILIPLGAALGAILSRSFPTQTNLFSTIFAFVFAYILAAVMGKHLAIIRYLRNVEKKIDKPIKI
jgi:multisubunit Na+/H+ antiporter MnhE subunit